MRQILEDPTAEEYTWSPDGRRVAYHSRQVGDGWGVWVMARALKIGSNQSDRNGPATLLIVGSSPPWRKSEYIRNQFTVELLPLPSLVHCSVTAHALAELPGLVLVGRLAAGCARSQPAPRADRPSRSRRPAARLETAVIEARVPRNATLDSLLRQHQLSTDLVNAAVRSAASVFNPRQLRADRPYRLVRSLDGFLREFEYQIDTDRFLRIVNRDRGRPEVLDAEVLPYEKETNVVAIRGDIDAEHSSLIAAIDAAGENIQLAMALAEIFSGQIDFNSDLQPGDSFEVLFEKSTRDGPVRRLRRHPRRDVRRRRPRAPGVPLDRSRDRQGGLLRRAGPLAEALLPRVAAEVRAARHLGLLAPAAAPGAQHRAAPTLGVDYGAPHGAAVVAVAAGTVVSAGWAGGGGNQVRIRHAGGLETYYLHLSAFAPGRPRRRARRAGTAHRPRRLDRHRDRAAPGLPLRQERRVRGSRRRTPPAAAGEPIPPSLHAAFLSSRDGMLEQIASAILAEPAAARLTRSAPRRIANRSSLIANPWSLSLIASPYR